jgi:hypothetical protein
MIVNMGIGDPDPLPLDCSGPGIAMLPSAHQRLRILPSVDSSRPLEGGCRKQMMRRTRRRLERTTEDNTRLTAFVAHFSSGSSPAAAQ